MSSDAHDGTRRGGWRLVTTADGYRAVEPRPSAAEHQRYYDERYYAKDAASGQYSCEYSDRELRHKRLAYAEAERIAGKGAGRYLDLGCGEGFGLAYFHEAGWEVTGVDLTLAGVRQYFPALVERVRVS